MFQGSDSPLLHCLPKVIRIEESREFRVDIDHMHIAFLVVPYHRFVVVARAVCLGIDSKRSVHLEL